MDEKAKIELDRRKISDISDKVGAIHQILTGNGRPKEGLVFKVEMNTNHRKVSNKVMTTVLVIVLMTTIPQLLKFFNHLMTVAG